MIPYSSLEMAKNDKSDDETNTLLLVIIAIILPPVAVYWVDGCGLHLFLNIILSIFFYLPGIFHALWLVLTK